MTSPSDLPAPFILTAVGREAVLEETLRSWDATDWEGRPVIHLDPATEGEAATRIPPAWIDMVRTAVESSKAPYLLFLMDDLAFHPQLAERLRAWEPLSRSLIPATGSLYNPGVRQAQGTLPPWPSTFAAMPDSVYGAQAIILERGFAAELTGVWDSLSGTISGRLATFATLAGHPLLYHRPSLVEHTAEFSSWNMPLHRAVDFGE